MSGFVVQLISMSWQATVAVLVVILLRQVFRIIGISKKYVMLLWLIPFLLLICPWKVSTPYGLWSQAPSDYTVQTAADTIEWLQQHLLEVEIGSVESKVTEDGINGVDEGKMFPITGADSSPQNGVSEDGYSAENSNLISGRENIEHSVLQVYENGLHIFQIETPEDVLIMMGCIWCTGMMLLFTYAIISYCRLQKRVQCRVLKEEQVYCVDEIAIPMVVGILKPIIYLPSGIEEVHLPYVLAHERTHIRRGDIVVKLIAYVVTCVHWFNPMVWLAFYFLGQDMEMACDEETILRLGNEQKNAYAVALLQLAIGRRKFYAVPMAFGEGDTKSRIKNIMQYKKTVKGAAILAVAAGVFVLVIFMTKDKNVSYTTVLTNPGNMGMGELLEDENVMLDEEEKQKLLEEQEKLLEEMAAKKAEIEARREETEKMVELTKMNEMSQLTMGTVLKAERLHILHLLNFHSFENGEVNNIEDTHALNYYVDFYFDDQGEEYRLGVSYMKEDDRLDCIYITRLSDGDMRWLYSAEEDKYQDVLEEFLATKEKIDDWLTVELPEGYTLGAYNANYGYMGGALIFPQVYELYGEDIFAPADWYHAGCISRMPDAMERYEFIDGKLQEHRGVPWNHTSSEFMEVLDLDWQAIVMEVNHDLYTAAGIGALEEEGVDTSQIELTSDYWYFFFVKEGEDTSYYLSLSKKCFTKDEAIAIARTVDIKE